MPKMILTGTVVSDKQDKTVVIKVNHDRVHPLYRKRYTVSKRYQVHDENNEAQDGDIIEVIETRPISKNKKWKLTKIIEKRKSLENEK